MVVLTRRRAWLGWLGALTMAAPAFGQRLPVRQYGVGDGLVQNQVTAILHDGRGFLWFGTWEGLSRFDGKRFVNYGLEEGLPHAVVTHLQEDPAGRLWIATQGGLATLVDAAEAGPRGRFRVHDLAAGPDDGVMAVVFEPDGRPWCLTRAALWRGREESGPGWTFERTLTATSRADATPTQPALAEPQGRLWFALADTLVSVERGRVERHPPPAILGGGAILGILDRAPGKILVAFKHDILEFAAPSGSWSWMDLDLAGNELTGPLARSPGGELFVGTHGGLLRLDAAGEWRLLTSAQGLAQDYVGALTVDHTGDLWIGHGAKGSGRGLSRLLRNGVQSWTVREGLPEPSVLRIVSDPRGHVYASTEDTGLSEITAHGIHPVAGSARPPFNETQGRVAQDAQGSWWVGSEQGLVRFPGPLLRLDRGARRFTRGDGFSDAGVNRQGLYADPHGSVWISATDGYVYRFDPGRSRPPLFDRIAVDLRAMGGQVERLTVDRAGTLWVAGPTGVARLRDPRAGKVDPAESLPLATARSFLQDGRGRLWVGLRHHGLAMTADPADPAPRWTRYTAGNGLASNAVWCLVEDARGRIYAGTSRGVDRLDPEAGHVRHFTTHDGLPGDVVNDCAAGADGRLWFALEGGVAAIDPESRPPPPRAPTVSLTRVAVGGVEVPLPERGAARLSGLELPAARNSLLVEYLAPSLEEVSYQYRLESVDREWSRPAPGSSVQYARLAPGRYRFWVRAVLPEGVSSSAPALLEFRVAPPFWRRAWFLALMGAAVASAALGAHRVRVGRLLALQRVRSQIARDLHDDLGSGLGSIGILAGLSAEGRLAEEEQRGLARRIADTAAEMGSVLSDIVWTLRRDTARLDALAAHLAERGARLFPLPPPEFETRFPAEWPEVELSLLVRRSLLLIALEALHNAARHAQATRVTLGLAVEDARLRLWVEDDGRGFSPSSLADPDRGMGLTNMRRRAAEAKAEIAFTPRPGGGTRMEVSMGTRWTRS